MVGKFLNARFKILSMKLPQMREEEKKQTLKQTWSPEDHPWNITRDKNSWASPYKFNLSDF